MSIAYEAVELEEMRPIGSDMQCCDRCCVGPRARDDARGPAQMGMDDVRNKFLDASLDRTLSSQPGRDWRNTHALGDRVDDGYAAPVPMGAPHDEGDVVFSRLKAREFRRIAFGSGE